VHKEEFEPTLLEEIWAGRDSANWRNA
jgi:hypothetical protein